MQLIKLKLHLSWFIGEKCLTASSSSQNIDFQAAKSATEEYKVYEIHFAVFEIMHV